MVILPKNYNNLIFMLYITFRDSMMGEWQSINNIWDVKHNNVPQLYIDFIHEKAKKIGIVINPHCLNIMNWENHNKHFSIDEYQNKEKQWRKIIRQWNIDKFISEVLKGSKQNFQSLHRF